MALTLFEPPAEYNARLGELEALPDFDRSRAELLLQVELGLALMELLRLDDEPVTGVWALLGALPIHHHRLRRLSSEDRRAVANARQLIPLSSRTAWIAALRRYMRQIAESWRNYDFDTQQLDTQIINAARRDRRQMHYQLYRQCLTAALQPRRRAARHVHAHTAYQFVARVNGVSMPVRLSFTPEHVSGANKLPKTWFDAPRPRQHFELNLEHLATVAAMLDQREEALRQRYPGGKQQGSWVRRLSAVAYHTVRADGSIDPERARTVTLNGFHHAAGMVASGKSTLSLLTTAHIVCDRPDLRITLVAGDTQSALRITNQINWWFCDDPEHDTPVAVPLLGRSTRDSHLRSFSVSRDYREHQERGQPHWGERWLSTCCALQALIPPETLSDELQGRPLTPGTEPCQSLRKISNARLAQPAGSSGRAHLCPFFASCPSQQIYHDMPSARVWVTTPGAMAASGLPRHLETRKMKLGELVYEQSDIVVFDEVETIAEWFDSVYAEEVSLANGHDGVFDIIGEKTEAYMRVDRAPPPATQRWVTAQRDAQTFISATLSLLHERWGHEILRQWVSNGSFTPSTLFYRLARRLAGLPERDFPDTSPVQLQAQERRIQPILQIFEALLEDGPSPSGQQGSSQPEQEATHRLQQLVQLMNGTSDSASDEAIHRTCKEWVAQFYDSVERQRNVGGELLTGQQASRAQASRGQGNGAAPEEEPDTLETLAYRLQFALTVALLDQQTRIVFYEWHSRPNTIESESPYRRMPEGMLDVLPLPLTGRQCGTYLLQGRGEHTEGRTESHSLSLFTYTNIGRWYVTNFHQLLTDLTGVTGPHVLALSGTSYLPHSTQFHMGQPQGILVPEPGAVEAIGKSEFAFIPQRMRSTGEPIRISGQPHRQRAGLFKEIARALVGNEGAGHLGHTLREIEQRGALHQKEWADRSRLLLLVNSYDQARWAADEIRQCWPSLREKVYHLARSLPSIDDGVALPGARMEREPGAFALADIETFAHTGGRILVAPMNAIGRGFNTLNQRGTAAFGAVYFLTRPYPHPQDTRAVARELNRRALDWVGDPGFTAWQADGLAARANMARRQASRYWRLVEQRSYYRTLRPIPELHARPREDLAATTAGLLIQAVGRLLRGGVPFLAYFVDAAWGPRSAQQQGARDTPRDSLLAAMIDLLTEYVSTDPISNALYAPLVDALADTAGFEWTIDARDKEGQ